MDQNENEQVGRLLAGGDEAALGAEVTRLAGIIQTGGNPGLGGVYVTREGRILDQGEEAIAAEIARLTEIVRAGEAAQEARVDFLRRAHRKDPKTWTQTRLAELAGISQPAVSKALKSEGARSLEESTDPAYLVGRLLGVAHWLVFAKVHKSQAEEALERTGDKMYEGKLPITPRTVEQVRRMIEKVAAHGHREAVEPVMADIAERLGARLPEIMNVRRTRTGLAVILGRDHQCVALRDRLD